MPEPLSIGVIGCGRVAQAQHLRVLAAMPEARISAIAEADPDAMMKTAQTHAKSASRHASYKGLIDDAQADAVVICLPTALHAEAAIAAFKAGKHVYLEKPIGISLDEAAQVVSAHQEAGTLAQIGFNYRFHPVYAGLREMLAAKRVGTVAAVSSRFCSPPRKLQGWKASRQTGGGVLLDLFVHHADLAAYLFDEPIVTVFATTRSIQSEDDTASITMTTQSGLSIQTTVSAVAAQSDCFEVIGDKGRLTADRFRDTAPVFSPVKRTFALKSRLSAAVGEVTSLPSRISKALRPTPEPSHELALQAFVSSVQAGEAPSPGLDAGVYATALVEAAEKSAANGNTVSVELKNPDESPAERSVSPKPSGVTA